MFFKFELIPCDSYIYIHLLIHMFCRLSIAALHYNENCNREQAMTKTGEERFAVVYPKAKKGTEAVVKPKKLPPTYGNFSLY